MNGLNQKLRALRLKNGYSQKLVSQRIGCSASIISSYEMGERAPSVQNLVALADLYHVSTDTLLGRNKKNPALNTDGLSNRQLEALAALVAAMQST